MTRASTSTQPPAPPSPPVPAARPPARPRLRRFRFDVGTIITLVVLLQSLLLVGLGYWGAQKLVTSIGESAHGSEHTRIEDKVRAFLAEAAAVVNSMADAPRLQPSGADARHTEELLWALLQPARELDSVYVADTTGRMLMVQRYPDPAVRHIVREHGRTTERWEYKPHPASTDDKQRLYDTVRTQTYRTDYDPLSRSWFRQAMAQQDAIWSAPYTFSAAQELGITYAVPGLRLDRDGQPQALVAAGDVTLGRLSDFVRQFNQEGSGESALLGPNHNVLARSDVAGPVWQLQPPTSGVLGGLHGYLRHAGQGYATQGGAFAFDHAGQRYLVRTSRLAATGWLLISWVPEDQVLGDLRRAMRWTLAAVLGFLTVVPLVSLRLARRVTAPVERLSLIARRIGRLELDALPRVTSHVLEIQQLDQALDDSARGLRAFRKFVPLDVVTQLTRQGHTLGPSGEPRHITVMFTDIAGFTRLAETTPAEVLVAQLTTYFDLASRIFARHGGTLDKYIGDGIMVLWGAPAELADAEFKACCAALELQAALDRLNAAWRAQGRPAFPTRIGLGTGTVIIGVLGSQDRLAYTALGDAVNVASRLEAANKTLGTRILISDRTCAGLQGRLPTRRIEAMVLPGRQAPLVVHELLEPEAAPKFT